MLFSKTRMLSTITTLITGIGIHGKKMYFNMFVIECVDLFVYLHDHRFGEQRTV